MNRTQLTGGLGLLLMMVAFAPANAYHIDNIVQVGGTNPGDWTTAGAGAVTVCESNGLLDDRNDNPSSNQGVGGLCTTGRNDVTGTVGLNAAPAANTWTRLDACDTPVANRLVVAGVVSGGCTAGAYVSGSTPASLVGTDVHQYTARVGAIQCEIPVAGGSVDGPGAGVTQTATADYALYYNELYAWWSFDGVTPYTGIDTPGLPHTGDGNAPGTTSNVQSAYQGHVTTFILTAKSVTGASVSGSFETLDLGNPPTFPANLSDATNGGNGGVSNNCGGSPSAGPGGMMGPAFRSI